jgi:hypothetical protein
MCRSWEAGVEILIARCLAHGRRQFLEIADNFPLQCGYVLQTLGQVYAFYAKTRERALTPEERLSFHKQHNKPVMEELQEWLNAQLSEKKAEPHSRLGKAITYLLNHDTSRTCSTLIMYSSVSSGRHHSVFPPRRKVVSMPGIMVWELDWRIERENVLEEMGAGESGRCSTRFWRTHVAGCA